MKKAVACFDMTRLILVRHAQSESNEARFYGGQTNVNLTELGRAQARETAQFLRDYPIDVAYSSDYVRVIQTAKPIVKDRGLSLIPTVGLREINGGVWEGLTYSEINEKYSAERAIWHNDIVNCICPGGDSVRDVFVRASRSLDEILAASREKNILIASHATVIRVLLTRFHGVPLEGIKDIPWPGNASVTVVDYDDEGGFHIVLQSYNEHLKQAGLA